MFNKLIGRVEGAKKTFDPVQSLHHVYGQIKMAYELKAITEIEFMTLNSLCVKDGINNPKYIALSN